MKNNCGNCNFQGGSRADKNGSRVRCLYDEEWHSDTHTCDNRREYLYNMSDQDRVKLASDLRNREESKKGENERQNFEVKKIILYILLLIGATLIIRWILRRFGILH